jgi:hypothetical protein
MPKVKDKDQIAECISLASLSDFWSFKSFGIIDISEAKYKLLADILIYTNMNINTMDLNQSAGINKKVVIMEMISKIDINFFVSNLSIRYPFNCTWIIGGK